LLFGSVADVLLGAGDRLAWVFASPLNRVGGPYRVISRRASLVFGVVSKLGLRRWPVPAAPIGVSGGAAVGDDPFHQGLGIRGVAEQRLLLAFMLAWGRFGRVRPVPCCW